MIVSWNWIKDYVDIKCDTKTYCDKMIMSGSNLESCKQIGTGIKDVLIGKVKSIEKHPDADRLVVCKVDIGKDIDLQIVTGANNLFEGAVVPVAIHGSVIPGPLHGQTKQDGEVKIKKGSLRGVESEGMLCGCTELGFDEKVAPYNSKDGIWILPKEATEHIGEPIDKALEFEDQIIDFEITPNRPDCLSMIGMARESKATLGGVLKYPQTECENEEGEASKYIGVEVNSELCRRYTARVIKDIKIEQSPWWIQKRLMAAGVRPINNIVDITNFVMLEYGQPLHAFDMQHIEGNKIIVDIAKDGEKFVTLDGSERTLSKDMLMIKNAESNIALAGVMGGLDSEITESTETVVLESANFVASSIRKTSKKAGIRTEASSRYEKEIDPNLCEVAANRACYLIEKIGAGKPVSGIIDVYENVESPHTVEARASRINKVLGTNISIEKMTEFLNSIDCEVETNSDILRITPPTVRRDLNEEVDFVEEIARLYGYDNLPMSMPEGAEIASKTQNYKVREKVKATMYSLGANEIQTMSFANPGQIDKLNIDEDSIERAFVEVMNPMGEDTSVMRTVLTPSMLEVMSRNYNRKIEKMRAFEVGTTFMKDFIDENALPIEDYNLCIGTYGEDEDFFSLKGMVTALLKEFGITDCKFKPEKQYGAYHPGKCARVSAISSKGEEIEIGIMGQIHPDVQKNFELGCQSYVGEFMISSIEELADYDVHYSPLPKYPGMTRDIAVVVSEECMVGPMIESIKEAGGELLESVELFDIYRGEQVENDKKSVAFSLTYRLNDRTLTDKETDERHSAVVKALKDSFGAEIR